MRRPLTLGILAALAACAEVRPRATYTGVGEDASDADSDILKRYRRRAEAPASSTEQAATVLEDAVPQGIGVKDGQPSVLPGYSHRIVGRFALGLPEYASTERRAYCAMALNLVALTVWFGPLCLPFVLLTIPCTYWIGPGRTWLSLKPEKITKEPAGYWGFWGKQ